MNNTMIDSDRMMHLLNCLYTDFCMLKDESWEPDHHSIGASIEVVETIAAILAKAKLVPSYFEPQDIRDES